MAAGGRSYSDCSDSSSRSVAAAGYGSILAGCKVAAVDTAAVAVGTAAVASAASPVESRAVHRIWRTFRLPVLR